jgi:hypothetical protein
MMRRENSAKKRKKKETIYQQLTVEHLIFTVVVHRLVVASFHGDLLTMGAMRPCLTWRAAAVYHLYHLADLSLSIFLFKTVEFEDEEGKSRRI